MVEQGPEFSPPPFTLSEGLYESIGHLPREHQLAAMERAGYVLIRNYQQDLLREEGLSRSAREDSTATMVEYDEKIAELDKKYADFHLPILEANISIA